MPTTDLDICNRALSRLGLVRISAMAEDTKNGRACNAGWPFVRDEVLRLHPWNSVTQRTELAPYRALTASITGVTQANPAVVTVASDPGGIVTGDVVAISGIAGMIQLNNREFTVTQLTATTYELQGENSTSYPAWSGGGVFGEVTEPAFEWEREYPLPAAVLRVLECFEVDDWTIEEATSQTAGVKSIFTDQHAPLQIRYIDQEVDESFYDTLLVSALIARMMIELAPELVDASTTRMQELHETWRMALSEAGYVESQEQTPSEFEESRWILARE